MKKNKKGFLYETPYIVAYRPYSIGVARQKLMMLRSFLHKKNIKTVTRFGITDL